MKSSPSRLHDAGFSFESKSDREARALRIVDAHVYGKRFIACAEEVLTAFLELQEQYMSMR